MNTSAIKKAVTLMVCFALIYIPFALNAHSTQAQDYAAGERDGTMQAKGNPLWILGGVL